MYAVVSSGGKQYRVEAGSELVVERLAGDAGSTITFDRVLLIGDGEDVTVGTPTVGGATVSATVLGEVLGPKLIVFKFKQKATYRRKRGHRQHLTRVRIDEISADGKRRTASAAPTEQADEAAPGPAPKAGAERKVGAEKKAGGEKAGREKKPETRTTAAKADAVDEKPKAAARKRTTRKAKAEKAEE